VLSVVVAAAVLVDIVVAGRGVGGLCCHVMRNSDRLLWVCSDSAAVCSDSLVVVFVPTPL
jgi:hypothetical protein